MDDDRTILVRVARIEVCDPVEPLLEAFGDAVTEYRSHDLPLSGTKSTLKNFTADLVEKFISVKLMSTSSKVT